MSKAITTTHEAAADRIIKHFERGTLLRMDWIDGSPDDTLGYERACLLVAAAPEVGDGHFEKCPVSLMPQWLAHLTPGMDDNVSIAYWPDMVREYALCLRRSGVLTPEQWQRLDYTARRIAVVEAMKRTRNEVVMSACRAVVALLDRAIGGDAPSDDEWRAAEAAVWASESVARATARVTAEANAVAADNMTREFLAAWRAEIESHEQEIN